MRRLLVLVLLLAVPLPFATPATASDRTALTVETRKPFGPAPRTFSATGAFAGTGAFANAA
jgi:hypothetical protein